MYKKYQEINKLWLNFLLKEFHFLFSQTAFFVLTNGTKLPLSPKNEKYFLIHSYFQPSNFTEMYASESLHTSNDSLKKRKKTNYFLCGKIVGIQKQTTMILNFLYPKKKERNFIWMNVFCTEIHWKNRAKNYRFSYNVAFFLETSKQKL